MLGNGILETTTTTGTGALTIAGVTGRPRFSNVFTANAAEASADLFYYAILTQDPTPNIVEVGKGWLTDANTLNRAEILATLAGGIYKNHAPTAINLPAATYNVICTGEASSFSPAIPNIDNTSSGVARGLSHPGLGAAASAGAVTKDRLYYIPIRWEISQECSAIKFFLGATVGVGGTHGVHVGVYSCNRQGYPGRKLAESGDVSLTAGAGTVIAGTFTSLRLPAGWYFAAYVHDYATTSPTIGLLNSGTPGPALSNPLGQGVSSNVFQDIAFRYEALSSGWSGLPANANAVTTAGFGSSASAPYLALCIA